MNVWHAGRVVGMVMFGLQRNHIEVAVTHTAFGDQHIGKLSDIRLLALENDAFQTMIMIEMGVHRRDRQIMMIVLQGRQALRQFAFMMVVNIGEVGHALAMGDGTLAVALDRAANEIAHGFRTIDIAPPGDQFVELPRQRFVERYGETLHADLLLGDAPKLTVCFWNGKCLFPDRHPGAAPEV